MFEYPVVQIAVPGQVEIGFVGELCVQRRITSELNSLTATWISAVHSSGDVQRCMRTPRREYAHPGSAEGATEGLRLMFTTAVKAECRSLSDAMKILDPRSRRMHKKSIRVVFRVGVRSTYVPCRSTRFRVAQLQTLFTFGHQAAVQSIGGRIGSGSISLSDHPVVDRSHLARCVGSIGIRGRALPGQSRTYLARDAHGRQVKTYEMPSIELEIGHAAGILSHQLPF